MLLGKAGAPSRNRTGEKPAEFKASGDCAQKMAHFGQQLAHICTEWHSLPESLKAAIMAIIHTHKQSCHVDMTDAQTIKQNVTT